MPKKLKPPKSDATDFTRHYKYTRDDYLKIISKRKDNYAPEEREVSIGWSDAASYVNYDIFLTAVNIKYILELNKLCKKDKGTIVFADSSHISYHIDKSAVRPLALKSHREMTEEQREAAAERMRARKTAEKDASN